MSEEFEDGAKYRVCPECMGEGTVVHDALRVWGADDIDNDPEGYENMMRGHYDVKCPECKGKRVIKPLTKEQIEQRRADAEYRAEIEAERRMGA